MTPPLSIGSHVENTGPAFGNIDICIGESGEISEISERGNFRISGLWYPASSLSLVQPFTKGEKVKVSLKGHLYNGYEFEIERVRDGYVEDSQGRRFRFGILMNTEEELEIGDFVEIVRPNIDDTGKIRKVIRTEDPPRTSFPIQLDDKSWWRISSLRKLTPEEIAMHTGYKMQELQVATAKGMAALGKLLAPTMEKHVEYAIKKLSDIESRMDSIGPSHAELIGDVEALAEKVGAIERRQDRQTEASDILSQRLAAQKTRMDKQQKSIDCLEAYQRGEQPEVTYRLQTEIPVGARFSVEKMLNGSVSLTYSDCGIELAKKVLDGMREA